MYLVDYAILSCDCEKYFFVDEGHCHIEFGSENIKKKKMICRDLKYCEHISITFSEAEESTFHGLNQ